MGQGEGVLYVEQRNNNNFFYKLVYVCTSILRSGSSTVVCIVCGMVSGITGEFCKAQKLQILKCPDMARYPSAIRSTLEKNNVQQLETNLVTKQI